MAPPAAAEEAPGTVGEVPLASPEAEFAAHASSAIPFLDLEPMPDFEQWGPVERQPLRSIRRRVARKMVTSMVLVPHVAHMDEADVTDLDVFRVRERERRAGKSGGRLTLLAFVVKAVTAGLRAAPAFNASLDPFKEEIIYKKYYNIGIAADTGRGLVVHHHDCPNLGDFRRQGQSWLDVQWAHDVSGEFSTTIRVVGRTRPAPSSATQTGAKMCGGVARYTTRPRSASARYIWIFWIFFLAVGIKILSKRFTRCVIRRSACASRTSRLACQH